MANNIIRRVWNQNRMVNIEDLTGAAFQAENGGHTFEISGIDDTGAAVALSGTVSGVFRRPDNADIALTGSASEGVVSVTLSEDCYAVPGRFGLTIFVTSNSQKVAVYACVGTVAVSSTGNVAGDTPQDVVDLINAIEAAVATIPADYTDLMAAIAPAYSSSALYAVGSYAWYDGDMYRCTTAITTAETWTAAHWTVAVLGDDVSNINSALKRSDDDFQTFSFAREYATTFDNGAYKWYPLAVPNGTKLILRTTDWSNYNNGGLLLYDTYAGTQLGAINPTVNGSEAVFVIDRDNVGYIRTGADFTHGSAYVYIGNSGFNAKDRIVDLESLYKAINNYKYQINITFGQINSAGQFSPNSVRRMSTVDILHFDFDLIIPATLNNVTTHIFKYSDAEGHDPQVNIGVINNGQNYIVYAGEYFRLSFYIDGDSSGNYTGTGLNNLIYNSIYLFNRKQIENYTKLGQLQNLYLINNNVRSVAHRGMSRVAPENTIPAFTQARRAGFEWVETDVSWTHDGVAVLLHDTTIDRTSDGTGAISDLDYDDIKNLDFGSWFSPLYSGTKIPTLDEFLKVCRKIGLKARLDIRAHTEQQLIDACKLIVRNGMMNNVEFTGGEASVINTVIPHTRIILNSAQIDAQVIANAVAIRNEGNDVNITTQNVNANAVELCANALIPLEYWTAGTDQAILNLDPYVTVVTTEGQIAGDVLYRSII